MKKVLPLLIAVAIVLCGCSSLIPTNGTLSISSNDIFRIEIKNINVNHDFSISDREEIHTIVSHLNSYTLENAVEGSDPLKYQVALVTNNGSDPLYFEVDATALKQDNIQYEADALKLVRYIEARECDTLTDEQLMEFLFTDDYLDRLNILNEDGEISLDKITHLGENCPALFELLSRPTLLKTIGSEGLELIEQFIGSDNIQIRERAEKLAEILKSLAPEVKEKIENILETIENTQK